VEDAHGAIRARNYVNVDVYDPATPTDVEKTKGGYALRFRPGDFFDSSWPNPRMGARGAKFGAGEAGWVEYALSLPSDVKPAAVKGLRLRFEAGARTARSRIGWKDPNHVLPTDYPQTEERKLPTDLAVSINGVPIGQTRLPDDPADAHGVLSAHLSDHWEPSSYGFLTTLEAGTEVAQEVLKASREGQVVIRFEVPRAGRRGGLNLYGARMGAYPVDPTLFVDL
jgi:predicted transcriptional regulator